MRLYSNHQEASAPLVRLRLDALTRQRPCSDTVTLVPQRIDRRLGPELLSLIVAEYESGAPTTALARRYGVGKGTLLRLLRDAEVTVRHRHRRTVA